MCLLFLGIIAGMQFSILRINPQKFKDENDLELCEVLSCLKQSTIIPVPKKLATMELNDRPVALTSVRTAK